MLTKYYSKRHLAKAAGVSRTTFYRWLQNDQHVLTKMGVELYDRLLPPNAVEYICQKHHICEENLP